MVKNKHLALFIWLKIITKFWGLIYPLNDPIQSNPLWLFWLFEKIMLKTHFVRTHSVGSAAQTYFNILLIRTKQKLNLHRMQWLRTSPVMRIWQQIAPFSLQYLPQHRECIRSNKGEWRITFSVDTMYWTIDYHQLKNEFYIVLNNDRLL